MVGKELWRRTSLAASRGRARLQRLGPANLLQVGVSIAIAALFGLATYLADGAGGGWQSAVRAEVKSTAAMVEDVHYIYTGEAPSAFTIATGSVRADTLASAEGEAAALEADIARLATKTVRDAVKNDNRLLQSTYELPNGGYDVARRLGAERAASADLVESPDAFMATGDRRATQALIVSLTAGFVVAIYLIVGVFLAVRGRAAGAPLADSVDLIPNPWTAKPHHRLVTAIALLAWVVVAIAPIVQLRLSLTSQRSGAEASAAAVRITGDIQTSGAVANFSLTSMQTVASHGVSALSRQLTALDVTDPGRSAQQTALGEAEERATTRLTEVVREMTRPPVAADGVDAKTAQSLGTSPADWRAATSRQADLVDQAQRVGTGAIMAMLAALLAGLAATMAALATTFPSPRGVVGIAPAALAGAALLMLGLAFLIGW